VGAGNSAGQGALFFSRYARKVTLLIRGESLKKSCSSYLIDRIKATPNIELAPLTEVTGVAGTGRLERVFLRNAATGEELVLEAAAMFIFIGAKPRTEMVAGLVELDEKGYVLTGLDLPRTNHRPKGWTLDRDPFLFETSVPGIFAAGDVRGGSGKRVAAAVGEGSGTVSMVHRYLETV
jgi:thioredoxin reductase (NADPH)